MSALSAVADSEREHRLGPPSIGPPHRLELWTPSVAKPYDHPVVAGKAQALRRITAIRHIARYRHFPAFPDLMRDRCGTCSPAMFAPTGVTRS